MKLFTPILQDQPISYAYNKPEIFRNKSREKKWGAPVYFAPPTYDYDVTGTGGYYYKYGHNATEKLGKLGNCTYWCLTRYLEVSNITLTCIIGDAGKTFAKYDGRKDGSLSSHIAIGDKVQQGDMLVFADNLENDGWGHIIFVEKVDATKVYISESAYSTKECYRDKACITYTLNKNDLITANRIALRPQMPFSEYLIGVIHTGDVFSQEKDYKALYEEAQDKLDRIEDIVNE